jgi:hypothetical protein
MTTILPPKSRGPVFPAGTWIGLALYFAITISYFSYVPIWDAMDYLESYLFWPRDSLSLNDFFYSENGHPSFGYYWPFWIGQKLFPDQLVVVQVINLMIGALAIVAFGRLAALVFKEAGGRLEIGLLTIAFAISPVVLAYAINMTMDSGVIAYFLATLWLLHAGRLGWSAVTALLLIFCKEAGILFYTLVVVVYVALWTDWKRPGRLWPLLIPFAGFAGFLWYRWSIHQAFSPWAQAAFVHGIPWQMYIPNPWTITVVKAGIGPFVLEFQWIFTVFIVAGLVAGLAAAWPVGTKVRERLPKFNLTLRYFAALILGVFYVVSRTVPFDNQRYFLPLYPLVLLCFFAALVQLRFSPQARAVFLAAMVAVLLIANFRTIDPLSKRITGTFLFGSHSMLGIATMFDSNDTNKDVLVYNLEHTQLAYLLDDVFATIKPTSQTSIVVDSDAWRLYERIDAQTFRRTTKHGTGTTQLKHLKPDEFLALPNRPREIYLLELPTFHNEWNEAKLAPFYEIKRRLTFSRHGYSLSVAEMTLRADMVTEHSLRSSASAIFQGKARVL